MPRRQFVYGTSLFYKGYKINPSYNYDKRQLDKILDSLEYYFNLSKIHLTSNYVAFEITLNIEETSKSPFFNPSDYDDGLSELAFFDTNKLKKVFPIDSYFYLWTREFKTEYSTGEHYHFMVIANHISLEELKKKYKELLNIIGVKSVYIAPRLLPIDDPRTKAHFHYLRQWDGVDGIKDAFLRYCYNAKVEQKISSLRRSFDGCRNLKPLKVISNKKFCDFKKDSYINSLEQELSDLSNNFDYYKEVA